MRITFVISSLAAGGAQRVMVDLTSSLVNLGHQVSLITYSRQNIDHFLTPAGVMRITLDLLWRSPTVRHAIWSNFRRVRVLREALTVGNPDVVVSFIDLTNILAILATRGLRIPVVVAERIDPRFHHINWLWRLVRRAVYPLCDALVVQTESVGSWARSVVKSTKIYIIPNAVPRVCSDIGSNPLPRERFVLGVGRLEKQKGFDLLLHAFAASGLARSGWQLVFVGDGPERKNLSELVAALGLAAAVDMPGVTNKPENWMLRCGIFVLSSRFEGFPNVLLEAMSMGTPCIAFDCPSGPADIINHGRTGILVPAQDAVTMALALQRVAKDETLRRKIGDAAREVNRSYSIERITSQWESLLHSVVSRDRPDTHSK